MRKGGQERIWDSVDLPISFFFFFFFYGLLLWHMEVPTLGVELECSCWPTQQPQQQWTRVTSETYPAFVASQILNPSFAC